MQTSPTNSSSLDLPDSTRRSMFKLGTAAAIGAGVIALAAPQQASATTSFPSYLSVKDYGATGNGVTNDTAAVNAAITAAVNGDTIYFPAGKYRIFSALLINKSIKLMGDYSAGASLVFDQGTNGISIRPALAQGLSNVEIENLSVFGIGQTAGTSGIDAVGTSFEQGIGYLVLRNVNVALFDIGINLIQNKMACIDNVHSYFNNYGIYTKYGIGNRLLNSVFEQNLTCGAKIDGDPALVSFSCGTLMVQCTLTGNGSSGTDSGHLRIYSNESFEITCCMIDVPAPGSAYAVHIINSFRGSISQCWIGMSRGPAVYLDTVTQTVVASNTFASTAGFGVALQNSFNCIVNGNTFTDGNNADVYIFGAGSGNNIVTANQCLSAGPPGSAFGSIIEDAARKTLCTGNVVRRAPVLAPTSIGANNMVV